ncbi:N-acetylmuramoyl-L-alanine amidase [Catellatospora sp. KI3]|uniref:N-acetylmuramoyl-L-alanine amidase n=1 Tax=Catellatospora sp. KI3 TaxID=3041620 RepID=UPI00248284EE|nr:N-acetylmuramoyl-L-alanine amidase [Catellatospora sp. KI3]MDI1462935.1 N-acetylmuramoyl-L-alanine amidase [Catellatospora sp. KI3]
MSPRSPLRRLALLTTAGLALGTAAVPAPAGAEPAPQPRQAAYQAAADEFGVPVDILLGVSYLESRWDVHTGEPSTSGGFGPMHLTDADYVAALPVPEEVAVEAPEDARGDDARPRPVGHPAPAPAPSDASLRTLAAAAELTGLDPAVLRTDAQANIRGGAALLSSYQRELQAPGGAGSDPAAWYGAVARYSGADDEAAAAAFADEVYATLAEGAARTTDDGSALSLPARAVTADRGWLSHLRLRRLERPDGIECPIDVSCEWLPAPYEAFGDGDYGNHDLGNRPSSQRIEYIVIHDTEASWATTLRLVDDPTYLAWHYSLRSVDGHIAQHVKAKDVGWHAGNWYVNAKSIGLEHEGFAAQGSWYTEALYRTSAKLVRHLALRLGIPLDRQHIIGHDNVPGTTTSTVAGMHWDPGPYWDWSHYFDLLKAPFRGLPDVLAPHAGLVTLDPDFATNKPAFTGCTGAASNPCPLRPSSAVILRTAPDLGAPLVRDPGRCGTKASTMVVSDHCARASAGQTFAVAERSGDWTAIWYLGQKAWFRNADAGPRWSIGFVVEAKPSVAAVPVYGRAYPEAAAYPAGVPVQAVSPFAQYTFAAGQRYAAGPVLSPEYYRASTFDWSSPGDGTVIRGEDRYVQIQFGQRIAYVRLADVVLRPSVLP